jgi:hypothetical protein
MKVLDVRCKTGFPGGRDNSERVRWVLIRLPYSFGVIDRGDN